MCKVDGRACKGECSAKDSRERMWKGCGVGGMLHIAFESKI